MKTRIVTLLGAMLIPALGTAATLKPQHNLIDAVTVFLDRAEVTRHIDVELPKGAHTIEVEDLPAQLIGDSLRVSAKGPGGLRIGSVEKRRRFSAQLAQEKERKLRAELQALTDRMAQLDGRKEALDTQAAFIQRLAALPAEPQKEGTSLLPPAQWPTAWQAIGKGMSETNQARTTLLQERRELQQQIRKVEAELRQVQTGRRDSLSALLHIEADSSGKARFTLIYQLPNAGWSASYDAHLATEKGLVDLTQAAEVHQASGEAWDNVALTVSTARPSAGAVMPDLPPWWIDFARPIPQASVLRRERKAELADEMVSGAMAPAEAPLAEAETVLANQEVTGFSVRYRIPGRVTVPADNSRQRFVLDRQSFQAALAARTTPKRDPRAFLYAEFDYSGKQPLLAGNWQLQRDGVYVGSTQQGVIRPTEALALAFGPDDAIKVEYQLMRDERGKQGLLSREQRVERNYRIGIGNGHPFPIKVTLYDQLPVARDKAINITLDSEGTPPDGTDTDDRPGLLTWEREIKGGGEATVNFGYRVSFPQGESLPGF